MTTAKHKPGYKTTEGWAAYLVIAGTCVAAIAGGLSPSYAAIAASIAAGLYAVGRGLAKSGGSDSTG